jgi:hypothetical protein
MAFFEDFTTALKQKWLQYYQANHDWLKLHMKVATVKTPDGGKRPTSYFILGVMNALEPKLAQLMLPFSQLNPDVDTLIEVLGLNFDPDLALGNPATSVAPTIERASETTFSNNLAASATSEEFIQEDTSDDLAGMAVMGGIVGAAATVALIEETTDEFGEEAEDEDFEDMALDDLDTDVAVGLTDDEDIDLGGFDTETSAEEDMDLGGFGEETSDEDFGGMALDDLDTDVAVGLTDDEDMDLGGFDTETSAEEDMDLGGFGEETSDEDFGGMALDDLDTDVAADLTDDEDMDLGGFDTETSAEEDMDLGGFGEETSDEDFGGMALDDLDTDIAAGLTDDEDMDLGGFGDTSTDLDDMDLGGFGEETSDEDFGGMALDDLDTDVAGGLGAIDDEEMDLGGFGDTSTDLDDMDLGGFGETTSDDFGDMDLSNFGEESSESDFDDLDLGDLGEDTEGINQVDLDDLSRDEWDNEDDPELKGLLDL